MRAGTEKSSGTPLADFVKRVEYADGGHIMWRFYIERSAYRFSSTIATSHGFSVTCSECVMALFVSRSLPAA